MDTKKKFKLPKFFIMISLSIVMACVLVGVSMLLYFKSGAAQLDLSRPDYQAVRKHAQKTSSFEGFNLNQKLNEDTIAEFEKMFNEKLQEVDPYKNSFDGTPMSNTDLEIMVK